MVEGLAPPTCAIVHSQVTICRRLWIQYVFPHMCGVNQFCIIVVFAAVKPANNILFCIELIQRPESSLRRHKLGLTDQSIRSKDDKTRFTCVHRLMTIGHSQNIWRKVPAKGRAFSTVIRCISLRFLRVMWGLTITLWVDTRLYAGLWEVHGIWTGCQNHWFCHGTCLWSLTHCLMHLLNL